MISENFVWLALFLNFAATIYYVWETIKGRVKPNKVTWILWAVSPLIAFAAEVNQRVGIQSLLTFLIGFGPILIFIASFVNKRAYWKITRNDLICGALSLVGLALWYITRVGNLAIFFSITADVFASLPTVYKAYRYPETENFPAFLVGAISGLITLLTIKDWNFQTYAYPLIIFLVNSLIAIAIKFQFKRIKCISYETYSTFRNYGSLRQSIPNL